MKGDFTGFSFNGIHSSQLGITRVSEGDRYKESLFPEISDRSDEITGNDGEFYFGSEFREKVHEISIAFDSMTELQFRRMRRLFGTKNMCELIFDERPYKVYYVKLAEPIQLEYICFDEHKRYEGETIEGGGIRYVEKDGERVREDITPWVYEYDEGGRPITERIYKGEGSIEFVAYYPFAKQLYKVLDYYNANEEDNILTKYDNVDEWAISSGILDLNTYNTYNIDKTVLFDDTGQFNLKIPVYNPGDLNTGFYLYIPFNSENKIVPDSGDYIVINGDTNGLVLSPIARKGDETGIIINSVNHLIEGVYYDPITEREDHRKKTWQTTRNIYNDSIVVGDFPKILRSDWYFDDDQFKQAIYLNCQNPGNIEHIQINYDYLYF